jgi:hypothetical protein
MLVLAFLLATKAFLKFCMKKDSFISPRLSLSVLSLMACGLFVESMFSVAPIVFDDPRGPLFILRIWSQPLYL